MQIKKILPVVIWVAVLWLGTKYLLPVALPFLLGTVLALAAEPMVQYLETRMPRGVAAALGVSAAIVGLAGILSLIGAIAVRELGTLAGVVPELTDTAQQGMVVLQDWMVDVSESAPGQLRPVLQRTVLDFFDDGNVLLDQVTQRLPGMMTGVVSTVGKGLLGIGTGVISAFLISTRLPKIKKLLKERLPEAWTSRYLPAIKRVRRSLAGWLKAQVKLSAVTWLVVTVGFLILRIPYAPVWAAVVALVDAVPILGTGTVLVPWAIVSILQQNQLRAIGLFCVYGAASITRSVLEPRLVGRQLGIDPLVTLIALYAGYRFWGIPGLLLTPVLASAAKSLATTE